MTPDERQLLSGLFDRIRTASSQPRDREAEAFINDAVRTQPYAPYLLAQTVIVQEQALRAANERLQELEAKLKPQQQEQQGDTGFLGNLGRTIFGGGNEQPPRQPWGGQGAQGGGFAQPGGGFQQQGYAQPPQQGYAQAPQQQGPWGQAQPAQGGGFLKGALGAAAGVAGGVLLANSISGLFRGSNPYGITSGVPGFGGGTPGGGETVINNYYEGDGPSDSDYGSGRDDGPGGLDTAADFGPDDGGFGSDDSYNA